LPTPFEIRIILASTRPVEPVRPSPAPHVGNTRRGSTPIFSFPPRLFKPAFLLALSVGQALPASAEGVVSLQDCEQIAAENHPSVRLADEEAELAELKKDEAARAMWPGITLKGERTDGKAVEALGTPGFREISYGVQASQPLIQGGRLYRSYRQARSAWESSQAKADKARQEVLFAARESYWNYVKALRVREVYRLAQQDLAKEKAMADKLAKGDVVPRQVLLTVTSQHNQASLALDGAEAELTSRLWQWTAALGLNEPPEFRPAPDFPQEAPPEMTLDGLIGTAHARHPDLRAQAAAAEAALQGDKAGRSLYFPKLSLNGFYGRSGGNFNSEPLHLREDWQAGAQLAQYFGGNTLNVSGLHQKTSPKIGQTNRSESRTVSGSVGLLDAIKQKTERRDAAYTRHQAEVQMDRTRMEVDNNVRAAYAEWRKALAQLQGAENDLSLARSDYAISQVKSAHREVPLSERAVSRNKLAQAEVAFAEALSGAHVARASLSRVTGAPDLFTPTETRSEQ
jgi:outer membrane protein TolC